MAGQLSCHRWTRAGFITATFMAVSRATARQLVSSHPADCRYSSSHCECVSVAEPLGKNCPPFFITVVTDMVTTHALWFDKRSDLILVPTESARERALRFNMPPEKVHVVGMPVADRYCRPLGNKRTRKNLLLGCLIVLFVESGGMGPLGKMA
jgi:1,2-diacylglycerol 3-beta-galactosyltransferase